jgi:hypothetical protein
MGDDKCLQNFGRKMKRPLERPTRRWEDNIKMDVRERGSEGVQWMHVAQDRD